MTAFALGFCVTGIVIWLAFVAVFMSIASVEGRE